MTKETKQVVRFDKKVITFNDNTNLTIFYDQTGASRMAMIDGPLPDAIRQIETDIRIKSGMCCEKLRENLGNSDLTPKVPALVSSEDWRNGKFDWRYPGATGPGFYFIRTLQQSEDELRVDRQEIVYVPMEHCPFCQQEPMVKDVSQKESSNG